jgi:hypothetical protein
MSDIYLNGVIQGASADLTSILTDVAKIEDSTTLGLSSVAGSLSHRLARLENYNYGRTRWIGKAAVPNGEIHAADLVNAGALPFLMTSGGTNSTFGAWTQILGSGDTPLTGLNSIYFGISEWAVENTNSTNTWLFQAAAAPDTATRDYLVSIGAFSEIFFKTGSTTTDATQYTVRTPVLPCGIKIWVRALTVGAASRTFNGYVGLHCIAA